MTVTDRASLITADGSIDTTCDDFLGGALKLHQPKHGYRAGLDAVLLAASVSCQSIENGEVLDCGAGVGTVGLSIAHRCPNTRVTLIEKDPTLVELAGKNVTANQLQDRVRVIEADIIGKQIRWPEIGLHDNGFGHVVCNPPFYFEADGTSSSQPLKAASHALCETAFDPWIKFLTRMTAPRGRLTMIHRADALPRLLAALDRRFGGVSVLPVYPRSDQPASRVIISGIKGSRAGLSLVPGLVLHNEGHHFTPEANDILRHGAALPLGL